MIAFVCAVIFVVILIASHMLFGRRDEPALPVEISPEERKHFSGFWVAYNVATEEVEVVGKHSGDVYAEINSRGMIGRYLVFEIPGDCNELLGLLVDPTPIRRRHDNVSIN